MTERGAVIYDAVTMEEIHPCLYKMTSHSFGEKKSIAVAVSTGSAITWYRTCAIIILSDSRWFPPFLEWLATSLSDWAIFSQSLQRAWVNIASGGPTFLHDRPFDIREGGDTRDRTVGRPTRGEKRFQSRILELTDRKFAWWRANFDTRSYSRLRSSSCALEVKTIPRYIDVATFGIAFQVPQAFFQILSNFGTGQNVRPHKVRVFSSR